MGGSHRRERLCALLWEGPDDPRAQLRWSLSKLRPLLDIDGNNEFSPLTDGLLVIRYLLGQRGTALVTGAVGAGATRDGAQIQAYLAGLLP